MKKVLVLIVSGIIFFSCGEKVQLTGSWIQPISGQESNSQGIQLAESGEATSINMHTLLYESWEQNGKQLILNGQSIGNGQTISFSDTLEIEKLSADSLILKRGTYKTSYSRNKEVKIN